MTDYNIVLHLDEVGWNPLNPSEECVRETRPPRMPHGLSLRDRTGIHRQLLRIDLVRRFDWFRDKENWQQKMKVVEVAATLFALRCSGRELPLKMDEYQAALGDLAAWELKRLRPAEERLTAAIRSGMSEEEVLKYRCIYDPAVSYRAVLHAQGWTDYEGNRRALQEGLRMGEQRGVLPGHAQSCTGPECSDDDVLTILEMLTADKPDRHLFHVTGEGKFRLGAREARDGIESVVGSVEPVRERYGRPTADGEVREVAGIEEGFHAREATEADPTETAETADLKEAIRTALEYRAAREDAGSPDWIAATRYLEVAQGQTKIPALARELSMDERTLQRAFERVRMEIGSRFGP